MRRIRWGQKDWIINYWLKRMKNPFDEPYSIRTIFYDELPNITKIVPDKIKENTKDWAKVFYNKMCAYLSELVLDRKASYRKINVYDDSGASDYIWQQFVFEEAKPPLGYGFVEYPLEVWVENNATYNSLLPIFAWNKEEQKARFQLNIVSQRGWANTQQIEAMLLDRKDDVELILNFTDFDPSGYFMPEDLRNRCERIGLGLEVQHIGILPGQIPEERKTASLVTYKKSDPRSKRFREMFADDEMVMKYHGYEIQALKPPEIRHLVAEQITKAIAEYHLEKRSS